MNKLLFISTEYPPGPGGIGTHAYQLCCGLQELGWDVRALSPQDYAPDNEVDAFNRAQSFTITRLAHQSTKPSEALYRRARLLEIYRDWSPDIVIASGEHAVWLVGTLLETRNPIWLAIWHGVTPNPTWKRWLSRMSYGRASVVIAVSDYSLQHLLSLGIRPVHCVVIPNGADSGHFHPIDNVRIASLRRQYLSAEGFILLSVGHVTERKGHDIVIRTLPKVLREFPHTNYLVAGLPTLEESLQELARKLGVQQNVHFLGRVDNSRLLALYNACDLFLMTSRHSRNGEFEGYGIAAVEAALCGKPAIVSDNSGLAEAVLDGKTGLVVHENDPNATAQAIIRLLRDDKFRNRLGRQAQTHAVKEQTWEIRTREYDRLLKQTISS